MTEDDLLTTVLEMSRLFGVKAAHFRPAQLGDKDDQRRWITPVQGDGKGFPDLTLAGPGGVLFRELKSGTGRLPPEQAAWLAMLKSAGADADVWRPSDLHTGRIERELRAIRKAPAPAGAGHWDVSTSRRPRPAWMK